MTRLRAGVAILVVLAGAALPAAASGHAALLRTSPEASKVRQRPPAQVTLTFSEAVEPRFAIVSVTDAGGHQVTAGAPRRAPSNPDELVVPLRRLPQGWYLVYWRVVSADGHPVRGAFTFAVGPSPGPAPQFVIPSLSETAATPGLIAARWVAILAVMAGAGLFAFRVGLARPLAYEQDGAALRPLSLAFGLAVAVGLVAIPVYLDLATAQFALRSALDLAGLVPLVRASSFGRALVDLEIVLALFGAAGAAAIALDRPAARLRTVAALLALLGAAGACAALLLVPGLAGHAAQTSPAALALTLDWLHLTGGSVWVGGLAALLVVWSTTGGHRRLAVLGTVVPRFSKVALASTALIVATGVGASLLHLPTLGSLWQTAYGQAILVKVALLAIAGVLAAVNLLRTTPRLAAAHRRRDTRLGASATVLLRTLVAGELALALGILVAAATLTSLPPPSQALAKEGSAAARVGPGAVRRVLTAHGYRLELRVDPNRAALPNTFELHLSRAGRPIRGAAVVARFDMLDMDMSPQAYTLPERGAGRYARKAPALVMVGHWAVTFDVRPRAGAPFQVIVVDRAAG